MSNAQHKCVAQSWCSLDGEVGAPMGTSKFHVMATILPLGVWDPGSGGLRQ